MQKEGKILEQKELEYLNQLISILDESVSKLGVFYEKKDYENFDIIKKFISKVFNKISEITKR